MINKRRIIINIISTIFIYYKYSRRIMATDLKPIVPSITKFDYDINQDDLVLVGDAVIDDRGLISHHLDSANNFYLNGIKQIITQGFKIEKIVYNSRSATDEDKEIQYIHCEVIPTDVTIKPPTTLHYSTSQEIMLYPKVTLAREKVYSGSLSFDCDIKATAHLKNGNVIERTDSIKNFRISKVPIIKGSVLCNTYNKSKEALMQMGEDPSDPGGYFLVKGEWAVDCTENSLFNQPKVYISAGHKKSLVRCEFISKPGDTFQNSEMFVVAYNNDGTLTIEVMRDKLNKINIPFFMVFRALGWANDKEMFDWIVYDYEANSNKTVKMFLVDAFNAKYDQAHYKNIYQQTEVLRNIVDMLPEDAFKYMDLKNKPENYHNAINDILRIFDTHFLTHIGLTPDSRGDKLKFLGSLVRKVILVYLRYVPQTDRDSYRNKRIHAAGDNYAKTFKTYFSQAVVMPIRHRISKDFNANPFSKVNLVNLVKSSIYADDFERLIVQTITSGNKATLNLRKMTVVNRLASQQLNRKNQLNMLATMRQVTAMSTDSAKHSERASIMRRVHMSAHGYICPAHTPPEGEKVGVNKQMTIYAFIARASSSEVLRNIVARDELLMPMNQLTAVEIYRNNYSRVFINGYLMGCVKNSIEFVNKYRNMRRNMEIDPYASVCWDNVHDEVQLFVDLGRLCRPLLIVYNNQRDPDVVKDKSAPFTQGLAITQDDIMALYRKEKTIHDLYREQKIEYITPEEQECCYVCPNFEQLERDRYDELKEYTHCDIQQAMLGLTALTAPYGNHNQAPRLTYQTTQSKQTCGYYSMNWPFRMDKEAFLQYVNETPLLRTMANKYLFPNGLNVMVAMACNTGYNQEDSLIVNKGAIERGLFDGSKFTFYKTEFEQKEELGNPDASKTDRLKSANYEKLHEGAVRQGDHIQKGDVLIGKYTPIPKGKDNQYIYTDESIVYKDSESAIVNRVIKDHNEDDIRFCKVSLRKIRPVSVGDKFSSRSGQKGICALLMKESDMLTTTDGIRPAIVFNPHGIPSRMTCSQLIESLLGNLCAIKGTHTDATMFKKVDIESIAEELEQYGYNRYGNERMISGLTGEYVDTMVFFGPTFYQRLQKFVADAEYSVQHALTDAVTYQPLNGQNSQGGLKCGEMEKDCIVSHGSFRFLNEKFYAHSDGYIEYICRCGKPAIVNHRDNIYKCKYCKDNADIAAIPTSYTSKLFMQELESINVGIRRIPKPFEYEINDNEQREHSGIDFYNEESVRKLMYEAMDIVQNDAKIEN